MLIRNARESDLESLRALLAHLHPAEQMPAQETLRGAWQVILANPCIHLLVAEVDGVLASTCTLIIIPNLTHQARPFAIIENVVTLPACRRRGLATALIKAALERAWSAGCYKATLTTGSKREETLRFYEHAGFSRGEKTAFIARPPRSD